MFHAGPGRASSDQSAPLPPTNDVNQPAITMGRGVRIPESAGTAGHGNRAVAGTRGNAGDGGIMESAGMREGGVQLGETDHGVGASRSASGAAQPVWSEGAWVGAEEDGEEASASIRDGQGGEGHTDPIGEGSIPQQAGQSKAKRPQVPYSHMGFKVQRNADGTFPPGLSAQTQRRIWEKDFPVIADMGKNHANYESAAREELQALRELEQARKNLARSLYPPGSPHSDNDG